MIVYKFYIKNYMMNGSFISNETEVYSVPILNPDDLCQFTEPSIKTEMSKAGSCEFSVSPINPFFSSWKQMRTLIRVEYDNDTIFRGRVLTADNTFWGDRKVHAEGDLAFLLDSQQEGVPDDDRKEQTVLAYLQSIISIHNSQTASDPDKRFVLGEVPGQYSNAVLNEQKVKTDSRKYGSSSWQTTMAALENLQKTFGGLFRTRYQNGTVYLDWLENYFRPSLNTQAIEVTKNLIDISDTSEVDNLFTELIPIGTNEGKNFTLSEKTLNVPDIVNHFTDAELNSGYHAKSDYINAFNDHGHIIKTEQFRNADTDSKLREYAWDYIRHNYFGGIKSFTIKALDMHHADTAIEKHLTGDRIPIVYLDPDHMVNGSATMIRRNLTATAITYYPHNPENNEYSIGIPSSVTSKEYGTVSSKKITSSSASSGYSSSAGISSLRDDLQKAASDLTTKVTTKKKDYHSLAWSFVLDYTRYLNFCYNEHSAYTTLTNQYPNVETSYDVSGLAYELLFTHMNTGSFGTASNNLLKATVTKNSNDTYSVTVYPAITLPSTSAQAELQNVCSPIRNVLAAIVSGYLGYINAHPEYVTSGGIEVDTSILDSDGLNLSSAIETLLPQGITMIGSGGEGYDISGASSIFTNLLDSLGITSSGGILSEENMDTLKQHLAPITKILDGNGQFSLESLTKVFPYLKDKIVNGTFTKYATDWLIQQVPILKYALGSGETQFTLNGLKNFISNIPVLFGKTSATVSAGEGVVAGTGLRLGTDATPENAKVEISGMNGVQKIGKDDQGNWMITINEPISYVDSNGVTQTIEGAIKASDFSVAEIPSFKTKFAAFDAAWVDQLYFNNAVGGRLDVAEANITDLEADKVNVADLYVSGNASFAGAIQVDIGLHSDNELDVWIGNNFVAQYTGNEYRVYKKTVIEGAFELNDEDTIPFYLDSQRKLHGYFTDLYVYDGSSAKNVSSGVMSIAKKQNPEAGKLGITVTPYVGNAYDINFNIADTQFFKDKVLAAYNDAYGRVLWPTPPRSSANFEVHAPGAKDNLGNSTTVYKYFYLTLDSWDANYNAKAKVTMKHNENGVSVSDGVVAEMPVNAYGVYQQGIGDAADYISLKRYDYTQSKWVDLADGFDFTIGAGEVFNIYCSAVNFSKTGVVRAASGGGGGKLRIEYNDGTISEVTRTTTYLPSVLSTMKELKFIPG